MQSNVLNEDPTSTGWLVKNYGAFIDTAQLAQLLGFRNRKALRRAVEDRRINIPLATLEGRRGLYASAEEVSRYLRACKLIPKGDRHDVN